MKKANLKFLLFNFLGLEVTWAACAYGAINGNPNLGVYVGAVYITLHFLFTKNRMLDLMILLSIGTIGIIIDSINAYFGFISFLELSAEQFLIPYWLITLWLVFSLMIPYSLYWLVNHIRISVIAGAIVGSFSYWLGDKLGALHLIEPQLFGVSIFFVQWGLIFPLALVITKMLINTQPELLFIYKSSPYEKNKPK